MSLSKIAFLTCTMLALSNTAHARSEPVSLPTEFSCQSDTDCVTARAPCGEMRAVNREYHDKLQAEWDRMATLVECAGLTVVPEDTPSCSPDKICIMIAPVHPIQPAAE